MSNLGTVKFCRQKKISQASFYRWKNKLNAGHKKCKQGYNQNISKQENVENVSKHTWVESIAPVSHPVSENVEISVKFGEFTVMVPNHFKESTVLRVYQTLVILC